MLELFAYLDPSTGSLFIQALIGTVAGASFVFRNTLTKVYYKLMPSKAKQPEATEE